MIQLDCFDEYDQPISFNLTPLSFHCYKTCAWSMIGERTLLYLIFNSQQEWIINLTDKTAVHIISNTGIGVKRDLYKFTKLIIT
jgi:hypothetical protein